jgi:hypothetical protein
MAVKFEITHVFGVCHEDVPVLSNETMALIKICEQ